MFRESSTINRVQNFDILFLIVAKMANNNETRRLKVPRDQPIEFYRDQPQGDGIIYNFIDIFIRQCTKQLPNPKPNPIQFFIDGKMEKKDWFEKNQNPLIVSSSNRFSSFNSTKASALRQTNYRHYTGTNKKVYF